MTKLLCLALPVLLFIASDLRAAEPSFTPMPDLPGGSVDTFVTALSANGEVAVGFSRSDLSPDFVDVGYPFRWTADTGIVALSEFPGHANGLSADGSVVVGHITPPFVPTNLGAFHWTAGTGAVILPGVTSTSRDFADAVSDDGRIVVGQSDRRAVRWVDGASPMELGGETTLPVFVSADGTVAAGTRTDGPIFDAFRWTASAGAVSLEGLPGRRQRACLSLRILCRLPYRTTA